jgi:hypothetical protein
MSILLRLQRLLVLIHLGDELCSTTDLATLVAGDHVDIWVTHDA